MSKKKVHVPCKVYPDMHKAIAWCFENNIKIIKLPVVAGISNPPCRIQISNGQTNNISPEVYDQNNLLEDKITELYLHYYKLHSQSE